MKHFFALALVVLLGVVGASAQTPTVVNPTAVSFSASPDHNLVVNGTALVTSYQLDVMTSTATGAVAFSLSLGKPTPDSANTVFTPTIAQLAALTNGTYVATVTAVGPGGSGKSLPTAPFARIGPARAPTVVSVLVR